MIRIDTADLLSWKRLIREVGPVFTPLASAYALWASGDLSVKAALIMAPHAIGLGLWMWAQRPPIVMGNVARVESVIIPQTTEQGPVADLPPSSPEHK